MGGSHTFHGHFTPESSRLRSLDFFGCVMSVPCSFWALSPDKLIGSGWTNKKMKHDRGSMREGKKHHS